MHDKIQRYSLRKLSVGLASVMVGACIFSVNGKNVKADVTSDQTTQATKVQDQTATTQAQNENLLDDLGKQKASTDNNQAEAQENRLVDQINYKLTNNTSTDNKEDLGQNKVAPDETKQTSTIKSDAEKSIVGSSLTQQTNNQSNNHAEDNSQTQSQKLDITKISQQLNQKELATNLTETNNKTTHSYTKEGSDTSTIKTPPKSLLASDNFDYSGTTTVKWSDKMTEGVADNIPAYMVNRSDKSFVSAYSQTNVDGIIAVATTTFDGNNYIVDPNTGKQTRIAKMNRVFYDLKDVNHIHDLPLQVNIFTDPSQVFRNIYISGGADQLSEYVEYLDNQGNKINIPLAYDIQIITSLDGDTNQNERVSGTNGSIVYPYNSNTNFLNNDPSTNTVIGYDATSDGGIALAIGGLNNGLTFSTTTTWGNDQWTMGLATSDQLKNLPYSEIDTRGISRNIHFVDEDGNQIQPTLTQTASWVSVKDKQGNIQTIGSQPNIAEYDIPHELTANGKTYLIDAFTDGNSSKLTSWTPANTDKNQDVYLVYKNASKVQVNYVDNVTQKIVKSDTFTSPVGADYDYNVSAPDGYLLINRNKKNYTGVTPSDNFTINIQMRKAIQRHYNFIETQPDGTKKTLVSVDATFVQRTDGNWGVPDFTADGDLYPADPYSTENDLMKFTIASGVNNKGHVYADWDTTLTGFDPNDKSYIIIYPDSYENYATVNSVDTINDNPQGISFYKANNPTIPNTTNAYVLDILTGVNTYSNILPNKDFDISYERTKPITDPDQLQSMGKRTVTITFPNGNAETIVQTVGFKRTGVLNLTTNKATYTDWVFDADTSNVTVDGQPSTQYQAYVLKDGIVNYAPIKLPHVNGYKAKLIQDKANPAMFLVSFVAVPQQNNQSTSNNTSDNVQSSQKPAQPEQKQPEPIQNIPAPFESDKEATQILNHISYALMHDSSDTADSFEPAQNDSDSFEAPSDSTQKDDAAKPQKVNVAKHKKHIVKKRAVKRHKKHAKKYHLKRRSRKHSKRSKKRIIKHRRTSKKFKKYSLKKHIKRV